MDDIQKILVAMIREQPESISSRKQLKAVLLDYLPQNKLQQNLILNAYDEGIIDKLKPSSDVTLAALQMIKTLSEGYGLTKESALWAVTSWCQMVGFGGIADVVETFIPVPNRGNNQSADSNAPQTKLKVQRGTYLCGYDFPPGTIRLKVLSFADNKQAQGQGIYYAVLRKGSGSSIIENGFFKGQVILTVKEGQRLEIGWQGAAELITS